MPRVSLTVALAAVASLAALLCAEGSARASGLYVTDRGVRPLGRGGAFVAGADDLGAIWYNPAGIADAGTSILVDASYLDYSTDYTRQSQVVDANNTVRAYQSTPTHGSTPFLPIPTLAGSLVLDKARTLTLAAGIFAPYTAITSYPADAASRYSLVSLNGSALVEGGLWLAYKPIEQIRIGAGFEFLAGSFSSSVAFNANPADRLIAAPEDSKYDAFTQLNVGPIFAPSGSGGVTFVPEKHVRIGISGQLPYSIDAPATIKVRLPNAVEFDNASQVGTDAHVKFTLPAVFRAGIEVRPTDALRIEATFVREFWTTHHDISLAPDNVTLVNVTGFPSPFKVGAISLPREFDNANSYRIGAEYTVKAGAHVLDLRAGFNYDESAIPPAYLSTLTVDMAKYTAALGAGFHVNAHWRIDAVYAHVFMSDTTVSPAEAQVPRINPVKGNPTATEAINGGVYSARADVFGLGVNYRF